MFPQSALGVVAVVLFTALARPTLAQTPPDFQPQVSSSLGLDFKNGSANVAVVPAGRLVAQNVTQNPPTLEIRKTERAKELLLLMVDLDTPFGAANHSFAPYLHWLQPSVENQCHDDCEESCLLSVSNETASQVAVVPWLQPQPPPTSPVHRFVVLAYRQKRSTRGRFIMPKGFEGYGPANRTTFDIEGFQQAAGLGWPVAANWFDVNPEDAVAPAASS